MVSTRLAQSILTTCRRTVSNIIANHSSCIFVDPTYKELIKQLGSSHSTESSYSGDTYKVIADLQTRKSPTETLQIFNDAIDNAHRSFYYRNDKKLLEWLEGIKYQGPTAPTLEWCEQQMQIIGIQYALVKKHFPPVGTHSLYHINICMHLIVFYHQYVAKNSTE